MMNTHLTNFRSNLNWYLNNATETGSAERVAGIERIEAVIAAIPSSPSRDRVLDLREELEAIRRDCWEIHHLEGTEVAREMLKDICVVIDEFRCTFETSLW